MFMRAEVVTTPSIGTNEALAVVSAQVVIVIGLRTVCGYHRRLQ